jgi:hypothetical protein
MPREKTFIPLNVYLEPDVYYRVEALKKMLNHSLSGTGELLIRKGLGLIGDFEIEQLARDNGKQEKQK